MDNDNEPDSDLQRLWAWDTDDLGTLEVIILFLFHIQVKIIINFKDATGTVSEKNVCSMTSFCIVFFIFFPMKTCPLSMWDIFRNEHSSVAAIQWEFNVWSWLFTIILQMVDLCCTSGDMKGSIDRWNPANLIWPCSSCNRSLLPS